MDGLPRKPSFGLCAQLRRDYHQPPLGPSVDFGQAFCHVDGPWKVAGAAASARRLLDSVASSRPKMTGLDCALYDAVGAVCLDAASIAHASERFGVPRHMLVWVLERLETHTAEQLAGRISVGEARRDTPMGSMSQDLYVTDATQRPQQEPSSACAPIFGAPLSHVGAHQSGQAVDGFLTLQTRCAPLRAPDITADDLDGAFGLNGEVPTPTKALVTAPKAIFGSNQDAEPQRNQTTTRAPFLTSTSSYGPLQQSEVAPANNVDLFSLTPNSEFSAVWSQAAWPPLYNPHKEDNYSSYLDSPPSLPLHAFNQTAEMRRWVQAIPLYWRDRRIVCVSSDTIEKTHQQFLGIAQVFGGQVDFHKLPLFAAVTDVCCGSTLQLAAQTRAVARENLLGVIHCLHATSPAEVFDWLVLPWTQQLFAPPGLDTIVIKQQP